MIFYRSLISLLLSILYNGIFILCFHKSDLWTHESKLFPDCLNVMLFALVLCHRAGDGIFKIKCLSVAVGVHAVFIVLPHWDNMS